MAKGITPSKVSKPVPLLEKPIKADMKELFKSLSKAAVSAGTQQWKSAAESAVEALAALGLSTEPSELAWLLLQRALIRSVFELAEENSQLFGEPPEDIDSFCEVQLDRVLQDNVVSLDKTLFEQPSNLPILKSVAASFQQWLVAYGLAQAQAEAVSARLPSYFACALNVEWAAKPQLYAPLKAAIDTPFTSARDRERAWISYYAWLQKQVDQSMFDEPFSLRQVYVPLRAYYEEKPEPADPMDKPGVHEASERETVRVVVDLDQELDRWIKEAKQDDATRVISGGPGSGKSSFARMYAAKLAATAGPRVLYMPLHQFDPKDDLVEAVGVFVRDTRLLYHNPLDRDQGEDRLLIIFDGLDELAKQGVVGAEVARQFVDEVDKTVLRRNTMGLRLQVLISGRTLAVQANASEFRKPRQILHLLPYLVTGTGRRSYRDPGRLLKIDQRQAWWKLYGAASGKPYSGIPQELDIDALREITAEPLLNYLVALSYARGVVSFAAGAELNDIYRDLLSAVYQRGYEHRRHKTIEKVPEGDFVRVLEEIGLAAWHGGGRTTTVRDILQQCERSGLTARLEAFQVGAKAGVTRLLTAFYFRQYGQTGDGDETFEFTHKSFGEYLAALRMVRALGRVHDELEEKGRNPDTGWTYGEALEHWATVFGPAPMDAYLLRLLLGEVRLQQDKAASWQATLCALIDYVLLHGMPMERLAPRPAYSDERKQARNAEEALLAALNACAQIAQQVSTIHWLENRSAGTWLRTLQGQRTGPESALVFACLGYLDLPDQALYFADLYHTNLAHANLKQAQLYKANLWGADLRDADLRGASLQSANLQGARLEDAKLEGANLQDAIMEGAEVQHAQLQAARGKPRRLPDGSEPGGGWRKVDTQPKAREMRQSSG